MEREGRMARVFRGKVAIPGEQMDAYLEALGQFERAKEPLRTQLEQYAVDFARTLAQQYAPKTVRKHTAIITLFIEFVCWQTDVQRLEEITRGIANSAFRQWYLRKVGDRTESELKTAVRKFFQFLAQDKGVRNEAVLTRWQR
jgi:site-specific recombinase XerD